MSTKTTARFVGALFLIAMVTSLVGGVWLESFLTAPDYLATISALTLPPGSSGARAQIWGLLFVHWFLCFNSSINLKKPLGLAIWTLPVPRTAIALRFFDPITAPKPP